MDESSVPIRVLHVDDEPGLGEMVATFLERADERITVETAPDTEQGLDHVFERDVDCVVSDYDMPRTNGIEFLEAVRSVYPDLPFILYTGKGSEEVASEAISAGVTDYLQKEAGTDQYAVLANRITNAVEHARSQQRVERSEQRLRDVIDSLPHILYVVDADGTYRLANEALADFHETTVDDIEGSNVTEILEEPTAERVQGGVEAVIESGAPRQFGPRTVTDPAGDSHVFEARLRPYDFGESDTATVLGIAADVTERIEHEHELRRKERRYQAIFNDPNILVGLLDTDGTVIDINDTAMVYVDADIGEVTGRPLWETPWFDHSESVRADVKSWIDRAATGEYVEFEVDLRRPDGTPYTVEGVFRPVTDENGDVVSLLITDRDVTAQRQRERAIEALHETAGDIMQSTTEEAVAEVMVGAMADVLKMPLNGVFLGDGDDTLRPVAFSDRGADLLGEIPTFHPGDSLAWEVYKSGETRHFDDVSTVAGRHNPETIIRSEIIVPIGDRGVAMVGSTEAGAFEEVDVSLVETLASHAETAFARIDRERDLERTQERYRTLVDHFPNGGVFLYDEDLICTLAGGEGLSAVGLTPGDVEGKRPRDRYPADIADQIEAHLERAFDGEHLSFEQTLDGRVFRVQTLPIGDDPIRRVMAVSQEVTESRIHRDQLTTLHDVADDLASSQSVEAICERTIRASQEVLDFDLSIISLEQDGWLVPTVLSEAVPPDDVTRMSVEEGVAGRTYRTGESFLIRDVSTLDFANPQGPYKSIISVAIGDHGNFQAVAGERDAFDNADLELAELLISHTESALDRLERERELERQNERLDRFAGVVSHDLRNPLNTATGYLELAQAECTSDHLDSVADAHSRIETLIDDILTIAREGEQVETRDSVAFESIVDECWKTVAVPDASLRVETGGELEADPGRVKRLLENLFRNAIEHGGDAVTVTVGRIGGGFFVEDDGPGIPEDERQAVFEVGYSTAATGNGLGLSIVQEIAIAHGWDVHVATASAGGARFEITGVEWLD